MVEPTNLNPRWSKSLLIASDSADFAGNRHAVGRLPQPHDRQQHEHRDPQQRQPAGGTLQAQNNKCMDVAGGGTANGTPVQLYACNGSGAQQFVLSGAGDLVNPQANRCVDIKDWNGADGGRLQLWDCAGTANQKWHKG